MQNIKARTIPIASILLIMIIASVLLGYNYSITFAVKPPAPVTLDPKTIPKYVNQLVVPPVYVPDSTSPDRYTITMTTGRQRVLPTGTVLPGGGDGLTNVWGYQGNAIIRGRTLEQFWVPDPPGTPPNDPLNPYGNGKSLSNFLFSPSATFETAKDTPSIVKWINAMDGKTVVQPFPVDPTLYWANPTKLFSEPDGMTPADYGGTYPLWSAGGFIPANGAPTSAQKPVPLVPHLHGAEVQSDYDGGPEAWWAFDTSGASPNYYYGPNYRTFETTDPNAAVYYYPNAQEANTLWYHDHALGITRLNVMSGLAGFYMLRDPNTASYDYYLKNTFAYGVSEIPIAIQDRTFKLNGEFWFPDTGLNLLQHPYWMPEFFGDTIMVNGQVWPNLDVTQGWYRLRLLDGSNARFYTIAFKDLTTGLKIPFTMIGADGGYLSAPVVLKELTIAPGERADILINFANIAIGTKILMENKAKAPFPNGAQANPQTTGQIMQFTVKATGTAVTQGVGAVNIPVSINPPQALTPTAGVPRRFIPLVEVMGAAGPVMVVINGQYYKATATETPKNGDTEEWVIINLTADTHPIHTHLATFQLVGRQKVDSAKYLAAWLALQTATGPPFLPRSYIPKTLDPTAYLYNKLIGPTPAETGWKDTIQMHPGEVTIIRIRFTQQDGTAYPFNPALSDPLGSNPTDPAAGYVWHCHIIDHEDNEMMRPLMIQQAPTPP